MALPQIYVICNESARGQQEKELGVLGSFREVTNLIIGYPPIFAFRFVLETISPVRKKKGWATCDPYSKGNTVQ